MNTMDFIKIDKTPFVRPEPPANEDALNSAELLSLSDYETKELLEQYFFENSLSIEDQIRTDPDLAPTLSNFWRE